MEHMEPTEPRREGFGEVRERAHQLMARETAERVERDPHPREEEVYAGAFREMVEPQVRDAVFAMRAKGYATESSGFGGDVGDVQQVDGYFPIDEETERALRALGVTVLRDQGFGPSYTFLRFSPDAADMEKMRATWDAVVRTLPDLSNSANPSISGGTETFIQIYAPERTDVLQKIVALRERYDGNNLP